MQSYLQIQNILYEMNPANQSSYVKRIKSMGFYILSYLLYSSKGEDYVDISLGFIIEDLNIEKRTLTKYISTLQKENLISYEKDITQEKKNTKIRISLEKYRNLPKGYELISIEIFEKCYKELSDKEWLLLCFIAKNSNSNFGSETDTGYMCMSEDYIGIILGMTRPTVNKHICILEKNKLISITKNGIQTKYTEEEEYCERIPNVYRIIFSLSKQNNTRHKTIP